MIRRQTKSLSRVETLAETGAGIAFVASSLQSIIPAVTSVADLIQLRSSASQLTRDLFSAALQLAGAYSFVSDWPLVSSLYAGASLGIAGWQAAIHGVAFSAPPSFSPPGRFSSPLVPQETSPFLDWINFLRLPASLAAWIGSTLAFVCGGRFKLRHVLTYYVSGLGTLGSVYDFYRQSISAKRRTRLDYLYRVCVVILHGVALGKSAFEVLKKPLRALDETASDVADAMKNDALPSGMDEASDEFDGGMGGNPLLFADRDSLGPDAGGDRAYEATRDSDRYGFRPTDDGDDGDGDDTLPPAELNMPSVRIEDPD